MRLYKLDEKVFVVKGSVVKFLNGLTSNTLDTPLNAFLNQHGRIIATVRQKKMSDENFLISVPSVAVGGLLKHLERYAKLSHVKIESGEQLVFMDVDTAQIIWDTKVHANSISDAEFTLFRLKNNIPLLGIDYNVDEFILNVHEYDYVSYTKGCFLGQEPTAKVHNRSHPSRKLIVKYEDECMPDEAVKMTSKLKDPVNQRVLGFLFVANTP